MRTAHLVDPDAAETIGVLGPTIQFLTSPDEADAPLVIRGTIPPGAVVPMHTHADPETFFEVTGTPEGLVHTDAGFRWEPIRPGDVFHVPGCAKHAFRNHSSEPAVMIVTTTSRIGRFFREVASPPAGSDPLLHFLATSERYGYWNATPEENAAVGIPQP
jgi:quercetin dioxygenase-like cupin family protein